MKSLFKKILSDERGSYTEEAIFVLVFFSVVFAIIFLSGMQIINSIIGGISK